MYDRKHSSWESEPRIWYLLPATHKNLANSVLSFRRWNIVIIAILGMMVLGIMLLAIVPSPAHSPTAAHAPLNHPESAAPAKHRISRVRTHQHTGSATA